MKLFFSLIFLSLYTCLVAQTDTVQQRIILIGDAGALVNGKSPVLEAVKKNIKFDKNTTVIYRVITCTITDCPMNSTMITCAKKKHSIHRSTSPAAPLQKCT